MQPVSANGSDENVLLQDLTPTEQAYIKTLEAKFGNLDWVDRIDNMLEEANESKSVTSIMTVLKYIQSIMGHLLDQCDQDLEHLQCVEIMSKFVVETKLLEILCSTLTRNTNDVDLFVLASRIYCSMSYVSSDKCQETIIRRLTRGVKCDESYDAKVSEILQSDSILKLHVLLTQAPQGAKL